MCKPLSATQKLKAAAIVTLMSIVVVAHNNAHVRFVNAEDDCAYGTYNVQRLPIIGLACIGEPK